MTSPSPSPAIALPEKAQVLFSPKRYKVLYGGRGSGKTTSLIRAATLLAADRPLRVLCAREFQASIKESIHQAIEKQIRELGVSSLYDIQRDTIRSSVGSEFFFIGLHDNPDKVKSYEDVDLCIVVEADKIPKASWKALTPTIRKPAPGGPFGTGAEIWIDFNPRLDEDVTYQRFVVKPRRNSVVVEMNWRDNPWFPPDLHDEMLQDKEEDYDNYLHVWEGHTIQVLEGAVFADELREMRAQKRICKVPYDRSTGVQVSFDLGRSDHTSMWFWQRVGFELHFIDFYQNKHKHISHYLEVMQKRGYVYDTVYLPHDAKSKLLGTKMSIKEQVSAAGYFTKIIDRVSIPNKVNAGRTIFPVAWVDEEKCSDGLHSLRHYRYEVESGGDPKHPKYSLNPLHDWASDAADAWCYTGLASKMKGSGREIVGGVLQPKRILTPSEWFRPTGSTGWMG